MPEQRWHIDKGIPVFVLLGLLAQFAWFSHRDGVRERTLIEHERRIAEVEAQRNPERMATLEIQQIEMKALMLRLDSKVDRLLERKAAER